MVVAVTKGQTELASQLRELGYDVVTYGEYNLPIDAIVYSGSSLESSQMTNANFGSSYGVLMISANNRTIKEIDNTLKKRTYSPLF